MHYSLRNLQKCHKNYLLFKSYKNANGVYSDSQPPSKFFWGIGLVDLCNPADKPTNQQTNRNKTLLAEVIMNSKHLFPLTIGL